jgi:hypothetical protein
MRTEVGTEKATTTSPTSAPPQSLLTAPHAAKHLDEALLAVIHRRTLEQSVLPGVPFH